MSDYHEKIRRHTKGQKTQSEKTEEASELDALAMLKLSGCEFKTIIINMLRALMDKVEIMQEQMDNVGRKMEFLRKS